MDNDPFERIPAAVPVPRASLSVAPNPGDQTFVPAFAMERQPGDDGSTLDVIRAIVASGGTFVLMTGCNSGTPYTYYSPQWTSNPTP